MPTYGAAINTARIPILGLRAEQAVVGSPPAAPVEGLFWHDTTNSVIKVYLGGSWQTLGVAGAGGPPSGGAGGDLAGSYPSPTIALNAVVTNRIADANVTMVKLAADTKDAAAATSSLRKIGVGATDAAAGNHTHGAAAPAAHATTHQPGGSDAMAVDAVAATGSLRTIGTGALQAAAGNDARFTDSRAPSGSAGGDLLGSTYPNPVIANGVVSLAKLAANSVDASKIVDATVGTAELATAIYGASTAVTTFGQAKADGSAVTLARSDHTHGTPTHDAAAHSAIPVSALAAATANVAMGGFKITGLLDGTAATDAATKGQLDAVSAGLDPKPSVRVITLTNVTIATPGASLDGVALTAGDRVLLAGETATATNGIYVWNGAAVPMTRATDMDSWAEVPGAFTFVEQGTNPDTGWVCSADTGGVLGTTPITWVQFSAAGQLIDGAGLLKTGNTFDVIGTANRITVNPDSVDIAATYAGQTSITTLGTITTGTWTATDIAVADGGTGSSTAAGARTNLGAAGVFVANVGALTAGTWSANITHGLNNASPIVGFKEASTTEGAIIDWKSIDANNIQVRSDITRAASYYVVTVVG